MVPDGKELLEATHASLIKNGTGNSTQIIGELGAGLAAKAHGFKKAVGFEPRYHGIDDIYLNGDKLVLVEAKGGLSDLGKTKAGEQLSRGWIRAKIDSLRKNGMGGVADEIELAIEQNRLQVMSARTRVDGPDAFIPETEIKDWADIGPTTWAK